MSTGNKQYVNENALYFLDNSGAYHKINCPVLKSNVSAGSPIIGYKSIDFKKLQNPADRTKYYYKHWEYACYECVVSSLDEDININTLTNTQLQAYFTALAREKYDVDKITKMLK